MPPKLFVVFYRPRYGNFLHWALHIEKGEEHHIIEVDGEHPQFKRNTFMENPKKSSTFLRQFFIAVLGEDDIERVKSAAQSVPVDNETVEWDCQDYVLEILDELQEDFVLDKDDEDYMDELENALTSAADIGYVAGAGSSAPLIDQEAVAPAGNLSNITNEFVDGERIASGMEDLGLGDR
ncbi:hypothetical protein PENFLA_c017G09337 [Penicillium flavigenum]|uniref:Uncharacterized protein n=1 Tax=Penicillium flavigenum TaxID=254877 RepID=A0A1V6T1H6_9EURO|nr:hypothetical protein PENFLA_c017G09337 [Penicillium flavigenum]